MTPRAIFLGLLSVATFCGIGYFNDAVMRQSRLVNNALPLGLYGVFLIFVILINPLLARVWRRLGLTGPELAVILVLILACAAIPGGGLMRVFTTTLVMPFQIARVTPAWQQAKILERVPPYMLAGVTPENENTVVNGMVQGLGNPGKPLPITAVPWAAYRKAFTFWVPFILIFWAGLMGLSIVLHHQWSDHERLSYPIANFTHVLLPQGKAILSDLFRSKLFWLGLCPVFGIYLINYLSVWYPNLSPIPLSMSLAPWKDHFALPIISRVSSSWMYITPMLYFAAVAIAYFIPSDISLAMGAAPLLGVILQGALIGYGIYLNGTPNEPSPNDFITFGIYLGMVLMFIYTGRRYYGTVLRRAVGLQTTDLPHTESVWGMRVFLAAMVVLIGYMSLLGKLDWQVAVIYLGCLLVVYLTLCRLIAETGLFFFAFAFSPTMIVLGIFGPTALGPKELLLMTLFNSLLAVTVHFYFMPFIMNSLKLIDLQRIHIGKTVSLSMAALVLGFGVAIPTTLYLQYAHSSNPLDLWGNKGVPSLAYDASIRLEQRLAGQERLAEANVVSGWSRFTALEPEPRLVISFIIGLAAILLVTAAHLRFTKWPIHPVAILVWNMWSIRCFSFSFLLGWIIKSCVVKYGGNRMYQQLKPLMFGIIAGELLGGVTPIIVGCIYYLITGVEPKPYTIFPT